MNPKKCLTLFFAILLTTTVFAGSYYELLPNGSFTQGTTNLTISYLGIAGGSCSVASGTTYSYDTNGYLSSIASGGGASGCATNFTGFNWKNGGFLNFYFFSTTGHAHAFIGGNQVLEGTAGTGQQTVWDCNFSSGTKDVNVETFNLVSVNSGIDYVYYWDYPMVCKNQSAFVKSGATVSSVTYGDSVKIDTNSTGSNQKVLCEWGSADLQSLSGFSTIPNGSFEEEFGGWTFGSGSPNDVNIVTDSNVAAGWPSDGTHSLKESIIPLSTMDLYPPDYNNFWGDENICVDFLIEMNDTSTDTHLDLKSLYPAATIASLGASVGNPFIAWKKYTLCGVMPTNSRGLYISIESSNGRKFHIDNVRSSGKKFIPSSANLCPLSSQSFADNPSCYFTVLKANGDYNAWCQLVDVGGAISGVWNVPITVTGASLDVTGLINELEPSAGDELTSTINVDGFAPDANLRVFFEWKASLDNVTFYSYSSGYATSYTDLWDGNRLYVPDSVPEGIITSGQYWRLDYNVYDTVNNMGVAGVSNVVPVEIVGQDILKFTAIENVDSNYFSLGSLIVLPTDENENVVFAVENLTSSTQSFEMVLKNSDNSGKKYKVYTATGTEYNAGEWTLNYTMNYTGGSGSLSGIGMQKLWSVAEQLYDYNVSENSLIGGGLTAYETKYYKFAYYEPIWHYFSVSNSDWDNQLYPTTTDYNGITTDIFSPSFFAQINSTFIDHQFPWGWQGGQYSAPDNFYLQVTAKALTSTASAGDVNIGLSDSLTAKPLTHPLWNHFTIGTEYQTHSIYVYPSSNIETYHLGGWNDANSAKWLKIVSDSNTANTIYFQNYSIDETGFFTRPITLTKSNGTPLPVMLKGVDTWKYITEGDSFKIQTAYNDPEGEVDRIEISAYLEGTADSNKVKTWIIPVTSVTDGEELIEETIDNVVDLTINAPDRIMFIKVKIVDTNSSYHELESTSILLRQFPKTTVDFSINISDIGNKQVGKSPWADIVLQTEHPNLLRGVKLYIHDYNHALNLDTNNSDFNIVYWKDVDFTCAGFDCSFRFDLKNDYIWGSEGLWLVTVSALLTTENENLKNSLLAKTERINVYYKSYETIRVFQTIERSDWTYNETEEKQFVLQVRDSGVPVSLKNDLLVYLTLARCDTNVGASGTCTDIDINYSPQSYYYEAYSTAGTGYNYYFWRDVFAEADGGYLNVDGNYQVKAHVIDLSGSHSTDKIALLAGKCADGLYDNNCTNPITGYPDQNCFVTNALSGLNHYAFGCQKTTSTKVTTTDNNAEERIIQIALARPVTAPSIEVWGCFNSDQNNMYYDQLEQDVACLLFYKIGEAAIDRFDIYFGNDASDFSKRSEDKQYLQVSIPYEYVALNDMTLMWQSLRTEFSTDQLDTIGEVGLHFFNHHIWNPIANNPSVHSLATLAGNGFRINRGFEYNFENAFDPNYISGILLVRLKGIKVLNMRDFTDTYSDLNRIQAKDFRQYMNYMNRSLPIENVDAYVWAGEASLPIQQVESPLVINQEYSKETLRIENQDINGVQQYSTLPAMLQFFVMTDLVYDHETAVIRRYVQFYITAILTKNDWAGGIAKLFIENWFWVLCIMVGLLFVAIIYSKFKGGGGGGANITAVLGRPQEG